LPATKKPHRPYPDAMVRTHLPVGTLQIFTASALVDISSESSCATASERTPVR